MAPKDKYADMILCVTSEGESYMKPMTRLQKIEKLIEGERPLQEREKS